MQLLNVNVLQRALAEGRCLIVFVSSCATAQRWFKFKLSLSNLVSRLIRADPTREKQEMHKSQTIGPVWFAVNLGEKQAGGKVY